MKLYFKYFAIQLRSAMQYKASFFMMALGQFLVAFSAFLGIYFMFSRFHSVNGFSFSEVMLCYSTVLMGFTISECFARGFDTFGSMVSKGEFDRVLLRPRNEIMQVLASRIEFSRLGRLFQAIIVLVYAVFASGVDWTWDKILTVVLMIAGAAVLFASLFLLYAGLCFFTIEGLEFMNIFTDGGREFGAYPISVYGRGVLKFLTYAVPLALVQYYPFLYLTGRSTNILYILLPFCALPFAIPCYALWRLGVRHYKSSGS
ncbi:MAG: ABC-2 family transporter protein [Bacillota bacterium]|nr:ABC-2 family transporter protein [Bacillota bacterium]